MGEEYLFTRLIRERKEELKKILESGSDIVEKVVILRRLAREIAKEYFSIIDYKNIEDFYKDYECGKSPLVALEGPGFRLNDLTILKACPSVALMEDFKKEGEFPEYWTKLPNAYMEKFKNESVLHALCIVHQTFRDQLAKQIPKGNGIVQSIAVACRSGTGKVVYSEFGLSLSDTSRDTLAKAIDGYACAFQLR